MELISAPAKQNQKSVRNSEELEEITEFDRNGR